MTMEEHVEYSKILNDWKEGKDVTAYFYQSEDYEKIITVVLKKNGYRISHTFLCTSSRYVSMREIIHYQLDINYKKLLKEIPDNDDSVIEEVIV